MSLAFEIEFLTGVFRAAREPGDDTPDWPPQPDRIFSTLVPAWAVRGENSDERAALEWLEEQSPPAIHASGYPTQKQCADAVLAFMRETIPREWRTFRDQVSDNFSLITHDKFRALA